MHRSLALFLSLILASVSIATTGFAAEAGTLRFDVAETTRNRLQLSLSRDLTPRRTSGSSFQVDELAGFDRSRLKGPDGAPVSFSLVREAGRLDCAGKTFDHRARGTCRFTSDPSFASFLAASGVRRPNEDEWIALAMVGTKRSLVQALRQGRYTMPNPDTLVGMTALGITPEYLGTMAAHGYRPARTEDFLPLKALDVSPAYIRSLKSVGYDRVPVGELIQLKALGITAEFIASYQRHGYRNLSVSRLIQLKALGIRPEEVGGRSAMSASLLGTTGGNPLMSALLP
jgi:hypothetical protein